MSAMLAHDLVRALDPVALGEEIGLAADPWQRDVLRSFHPRILLNCARQVGKSTVSGVVAVHSAVYEPGSTVLLLSPSLRQSGELFKKCLATYRSLGRAVVTESENASTLVLENGSRIVSLPGTSDTIRAYSAVRLLVVDEASRVRDELMAAIRPMLAVSSGRIIALSTPAGKRGWFWEAWNSKADWMRVLVTAAECPRISQEFLEEERAALGDYLYRQEYEGVFAEGAEQVFSEEVIQRSFDRGIASLALG